MKRSLLILSFILLFFGSYAQVKKHPVKKAKKPAAELKLHNDADSISYAYGISLIKDLKARGIKNLNYVVFDKALMDGLADQKVLMTADQSRAVIADHIILQYAANAKQANEFMATNKTKSGVITTPSGLQYIVLQDAPGPKPKLTDTVTANYLGTLIDGRKFDSSYDRHQAFVTALTAVIKGWTEGLQLMSVGSKYRFFIPYQLAYGERGSGKVIPPYSAILFDVELLKIGR
jgi:FKBP-type peptidyl-prolyl cis-trans isomerase